METKCPVCGGPVKVLAHDDGMPRWRSTPDQELVARVEAETRERIATYIETRHGHIGRQALALHIRQGDEAEIYKHNERLAARNSELEQENRRLSELINRRASDLEERVKEIENRWGRFMDGAISSATEHLTRQ